MKFTPMNGQVLIRKAISNKEEKLSSGGIVIPQNAGAQFTVNKAEVIKIGNPFPDNPNAHKYQVQVGDEIYIRNWSGNDIMIDGEDYALIMESEILGFRRE